MKFDEMGLRPELLRAVSAAGYETPTPIQTQAIPVALGGRDVIGCAKTGTGKTAAFLLPLLERLAGAPKSASVRALVLAPTRELAAQILDSARTYGRHLPIKSIAVYGGVGMSPQTDALRRGVDLLIATPGRLLDHIGRRNAVLTSVEVLVLDEADRMLDLGFLPDVQRILATLPRRRQNLFFSATMPKEVEDLIRENLRDPVLIEVSPRATTVASVRQVMHRVAGERKRDLLAQLLQKDDMRQVLVFTRTKVRADRLARQLAPTGRRIEAIHGGKSQGARTRALDGFKSGRVDTLVATDIAARGIDVDGISHVVNFDVPNVPEDYVHRIGRTGRAEASGDAISLVSHEELGFVRAIERLIGMRIPCEPVPGFVAEMPAAAGPGSPARHVPSYGARPPAHAGSWGRKPTHRNARARG